MVAKLVGDSEEVVMKVYNHIMMEKEDKVSAVNNALSFVDLEKKWNNQWNKKWNSYKIYYHGFLRMFLEQKWNMEHVWNKYFLKLLNTFGYFKGMIFRQVIPLKTV